MKRAEALFEKMKSNLVLQKEFLTIINTAESLEEVKTKLEAFAQKAGFEVSYDEIKTAYQKISERGKGELAEDELDSVAGGFPGLIDETSAYILTPTCDTLSIDVAYGFCAVY